MKRTIIFILLLFVAVSCVSCTGETPGTTEALLSEYDMYTFYGGASLEEVFHSLPSQSSGNNCTRMLTEEYLTLPDLSEKSIVFSMKKDRSGVYTGEEQIEVTWTSQKDRLAILYLNYIPKPYESESFWVGRYERMEEYPLYRSESTDWTFYVCVLDSNNHCRFNISNKLSETEKEAIFQKLYLLCQELQNILNAKEV